MALHQYRAVFLISMAILSLFIASPLLQRFVYFPQTTFFTELSLFGQYNNASYPTNVSSGGTFRLYINIDNHLGSLAYYEIDPKFGNQTKYTPDSFNHTSSVLPSLGSITAFAADNESVQLPIDVSIQYKVVANNSRLLDVQSVTINGETISVSPMTVAWNQQKNGFYGNLFFELWLFNDTTNAFLYHQRYVSLWLKMDT